MTSLWTAESLFCSVMKSPLLTFTPFHLSTTRVLLYCLAITTYYSVTISSYYVGNPLPYLSKRPTFSNYTFPD